MEGGRDERARPARRRADAVVRGPRRGHPMARTCPSGSGKGASERVTTSDSRVACALDIGDGSVMVANPTPAYRARGDTGETCADADAWLSVPWVVGSYTCPTHRRPLRDGRAGRRRLLCRISDEPPGRLYRVEDLRAIAGCSSSRERPRPRPPAWQTGRRRCRPATWARTGRVSTRRGRSSASSSGGCSHAHWKSSSSWTPWGRVGAPRGEQGAERFGHGAHEAC